MSGAQTVGAAWRAWRDRFLAAGLDTASLDARLLIAHVLSCEGAGLAIREREILPDRGAQELAGLGARRLGGEPVARILGHKEFYGLDFRLNAATLVPRPETELLVDLGRDFLASRPAPRLLDLGTGTGCIPISLLVHLPGATGIGVDLSETALAEAAANARRHGVLDRLSLRAGDWFSPLADGSTFDLIVSNPPYIETGALAGLQREVRAFDPALALDGGADGLTAYRALAQGARAYLAADGALMVEIGMGQSAAVAALLGAAGFAQVDMHRDLAGHIRVLVARP